MTVNGRTLGDNIAGAEVFDDDVIRPLEQADLRRGRAGRAARQPGARRRDHQAERVRRRACCRHSGRALVFDDYPSLKQAVDDPELDVTGDDVLVLRYAGPQGGPGMPEWGMLPIPTKLLKQGVKDMLRLSRCAHERHQLRRLPAALLARGLRRRPARAGARPATASRWTCRRGASTWR